MIFLGIDTSNYTTSMASVGAVERSCARLLPVKPGELGLRQSDALFAHIKSLPDLADRLFSDMDREGIAAIGVSTRPRAVEGSYMPCFLAGESQASVLASALHVPLFRFSHQQGHIAAVCCGAGRGELLDRPLLAWHLSGGTTELLYVEPEGRNVRAEKLGGTTDISAGQLIDRTGQLLRLDFPAGRALDTLSGQAEGTTFFKVKCRDMAFSLSGVQNKVTDFFERTGDPAETAAYALRCVAYAVKTATAQARELHPGLPVIFSGGVASNTLLRREMEPLGGVFGPPEYSRDNAYGVACLTRRAWGGQ